VASHADDVAAMYVVTNADGYRYVVAPMVDGFTPTSMFVVRPLGLGLDEKALEAVAQWRFKPGEKGGKTVAVQAADARRCT
ncbi:MAG: energy transducer TonB, partial [Acidocella sp.]|uniref:energy transducer TonB n=1 Tax=Acidocella sp. TaxID=50710 RepID=UPI003FD6E3A0